MKKLLSILIFSSALFLNACAPSMYDYYQAVTNCRSKVPNTYMVFKTHLLQKNVRHFLKSYTCKGLKGDHLSNCKRYLKQARTFPIALDIIKKEMWLEEYYYQCMNRQPGIAQTTQERYRLLKIEWQSWEKTLRYYQKKKACNCP